MENLISFILYLFTNERIKDVGNNYAKFIYECRGAADCAAEFFRSVNSLVDDFERSRKDGDTYAAGQPESGSGASSPEDPRIP
jgi:hypothetical protein